jgi:glycosyltransferase involved in cell wall biosynthesis
MPKVSVIIPTYNYGRFLGEALQSVLNQTFADFEIIVVDDGSTDNTRDVAARFNDNRIRYIYQENRGVSAARNAAIWDSKGEHIAFLDADDIWLPEKLELQVKVLDLRPEVAIVCSDTYFFDDQTGDILGRFWHDDKQFHGWFNPREASQNALRYLLYRGCFIAPTVTMVRREVFHVVGGFDEALKTHEDWDMFVRITQRFAIETIDMPLAKNRRHGANLSAKQEQMYESEQKALQKAIFSYSLKPDEIKIAKRRLAHLHFLYGSRSVADGKVKLGRERLLASIRINPWYIKAYIHLVKSLLGSKLIIAGKSCKREVRSRLVWHNEKC